MTHRAYLGLGSNVGDRDAMLAGAREALEASGVRVRRVSPVYETAPVGPVPQPDFLNQVLEVETDLDPRGLLRACRSVEASLGRVRTVRWGPRTIDVDVLVFDDAAVAEPDLVIPHPELHRRAFVLRPLADLDPSLVVRGRTVREWLADLDGVEVRRRG